MDICRSFQQDFPEFTERARNLGIRVSLGSGRRNGRERVFWLDGYKQLTGYTTRSDGAPFTHADAVKNIDKVLSDIEEDRKVMAALTVAERFSRVMDEFRKITPQYRMIGDVRLPCGDGGHCFFMANYDGGVRLHSVGDVATARADWLRGETYREHFARFCDALEESFAARAALGGPDADQS